MIGRTMIDLAPAAVLTAASVLMMAVGAVSMVRARRRRVARPLTLSKGRR